MDSRKLFPPIHITFPMNFKKYLLVFKKLLFPLLEMLMIGIGHTPSKINKYRFVSCSKGPFEHSTPSKTDLVFY